MQNHNKPLFANLKLINFYINTTLKANAQEWKLKGYKLSLARKRRNDNKIKGFTPCWKMYVENREQVRHNLKGCIQT